MGGTFQCSRPAPSPAEPEIDWKPVAPALGTQAVTDFPFVPEIPIHPASAENRSNCWRTTPSHLVAGLPNHNQPLNYIFIIEMCQRFPKIILNHQATCK